MTMLFEVKTGFTAVVTWTHSTGRKESCRSSPLLRHTHTYTYTHIDVKDVGMLMLFHLSLFNIVQSALSLIERLK